MNSSCEIFTKEELRQMLIEARRALHELAIGDRLFEIRDQNGELIRYTRQNKKELMEYIQWLESQLGCRKVLKPIEFRF
jgi:hypothetical protein